MTRRVAQYSLAVGASLAMSVGLIGGVSITASADDDLTARVDSILSNVPQEHLILENNAGIAQRRGVSTLDSLSAHGQEGSSIGIRPEAANDVKRTATLTSGAVAYDHGDSVTVPLEKTDGSVQIVTIVESAASPTQFAYHLDLPDGARLEVGESGAVLILGADGGYLGGVAVPWAVDATGADVPTRFAVDGNSLIQFVDHLDGSTSYPVVADPWLGRDLYYHPRVSGTNARYTISVRPTPYGGNMASPVNLYMWWAHADEVKNKLGGDSWRWNNNIQEQFYCHIAGYPISARPDYDMESWRPFMFWEQSALHKCNP